MLTLQRASAGSGKTFMLAKQFIRLYISIPDGEKRRLRNKAELSDSLDHILAITFTNKATNEMKQRIINKLWSIAVYNGQGKMPDYLQDFTSEFNVSTAEVSRVCALALHRLLNDFSDFHVSTIDSFFQGVLRTFAYEVDINDSYQLELNADFLAGIGIDSTLENLALPGERSSEANYWIETLIRREKERESSWDIFRKPQSEGALKSIGSYASFFRAVKNIENEDFKFKRAEIDEYFENNPDFCGLYEALIEKYEGVLKRRFGELREEAVRLRDLLEEAGVAGIPAKQFRPNSHWNKVMSWRYDTIVSAKNDFSPVKTGPKSVFAKKISDPVLLGNVESQYESFLKAKEKWVEILNTPETRHWFAYKPNMPYLGLLKEVRERRRQYLEESNTIELAETNSILRDIIGEDDTPFIYERLGSRLNHFLIDEFQDTSALQWENIEHLLQESESRGNENLIIGDAKQSIYRFRNADPSIITEKVPGAFSSVHIGGMSVKANANWRSRRNIVNFNNLVFRELSGVVRDLSTGVIDFRNLYANVVQIPKGRDGGFVEISVVSSSSEIYSRTVGERVVNKILELRDRGWQCRQIAVLVQRHSEAEKIVQALLKHNSGETEPSQRIEFVGESSLQIENSMSVRLIVAALQAIAQGGAPQEDKDKRSNWKGLRGNFSFYAMRHPELTVAEQIRGYLKESDSADAIASLLGDMQTTALPALTEAIIKAFVPEKLRGDEVAYIAAFQDFVLEYCERYPSDISSFLNYWKLKKDKVCVTLPDGLDAVNIMTVHKSKGLEFECVIIPFANSEFSASSAKSKSEWRWVEPLHLSIEGRTLPPYLPVDTNDTLENTDHVGDLNEFIDLVAMDKLNAAYVGFTRAVSELYIWGSVPSGRKSAAGREKESEEKKNPSGATLKGNILSSIVAQTMISLVEGDVLADSSEPLTRPDDVEVICEDDETIVRIGAPVSADGIKRDEEENFYPETEYFVNSGLGCLRYKEVDVVEDDEEDDRDPRSEGSILHSIMENVERAEDIDSAILRLRVQGLIDRNRGKNMKDLLMNAISQPLTRAWFDGSLKSMRERSLLFRGLGERRPDRVMIDGSEAIVVDYKFGSSANSASRYRRQVKSYIDWLEKSGKFTSVKGYLWYIREGKLVEVG